MANKTLGTRQKMVFRPSPGRQDFSAANRPQYPDPATRRRPPAGPLQAEAKKKGKDENDG
jgi:hypothetical protein